MSPGAPGGLTSPVPLIAPVNIMNHNHMKYDVNVIHTFEYLYAYFTD